MQISSQINTQFLKASCSSCNPTNSVKAINAALEFFYSLHYNTNSSLNMRTSVLPSWSLNNSTHLTAYRERLDWVVTACPWTDTWSSQSRHKLTVQFLLYGRHTYEKHMFLLHWQRRLENSMTTPELSIHTAHTTVNDTVNAHLIYIMHMWWYNVRFCTSF